MLNIADEVIRHKILVAPPRVEAKPDDAKRPARAEAAPAPAETLSTGADGAESERTEEGAASPAPA